MENDSEYGQISILELVQSEEGLEILSDLTGLSMDEVKKAAERIIRENGLTLKG